MRRATITHQKHDGHGDHGERPPVEVGVVDAHDGEEEEAEAERAGQAERGERELGHDEGGAEQHADQDDRGLVGDLDHGPTLNPIPRRPLRRGRVRAGNAGVLAPH